jgi:hypothetical protein
MIGDISETVDRLSVQVEKNGRAILRSNNKPPGRAETQRIIIIFDKISWQTRFTK